MQNERLIGFDIARSLAIFGMIVVNFSIVFSNGGTGSLSKITGFLSGKAAATFVFLAGAGIGLLFRTAILEAQTEKFKKLRRVLFKRSILLFVVGLLYLPLWPADILHFYGIYILICIPLIRVKPVYQLIIALAFLPLYLVMISLFDYEQGWNFSTLEYSGMFTPTGFFSNLFFNGFHPVIPWVAFMLIGMWFTGAQLFLSSKVKRVATISAVLLVVSQVISYQFAPKDLTESVADWPLLFSVEPMPPLPLYILNGTSAAILCCSICLILAKSLPDSVELKMLAHTGQHALTHYVSHVIIGIGFAYLLFPELIGQLPLSFAISYAVFFSCASLIFSHYWTEKFKRGPLEYLMRRICG